MISLKYWNALSQASRNEICTIVGVGNAEAKEYHHNFDYDLLGKKVKHVLSCCNLQKDGTINVTVNVQPTVVGDPKARREPYVPVKEQRRQVYKQKIEKSFESACSVLEEVVNLYGEKRRSSKVINVSTHGWNFMLESFEIMKSKLYLNLYWQGDSTDGEECIEWGKVKESLLRGRDYIIPADSFFDGQRTRVRHSDIRISRSEVYEAIKQLL